MQMNICVNKQLMPLNSIHFNSILYSILISSTSGIRNTNWAHGFTLGNVKAPMVDHIDSRIIEECNFFIGWRSVIRFVFSAVSADVPLIIDFTVLTRSSADMFTSRWRGDNNPHSHRPPPYNTVSPPPPPDTEHLARTSHAAFGWKWLELPMREKTLQERSADVWHLNETDQTE